MADTRKKLILNFSVIEFFFFALFGVSTYLTVYLMEAGFDSDQIGRLTSAGTLLGTLFLPFWGHLSDHIGSSKKTYLFCMSATAILFGMFPLLGSHFSGNLLPFSIIVPLTMLFRQPTNALLDGWVVSQTAPHHIPYGLIRRWGSVGFSICTIFSSFLLDSFFSVSSMFYFMPILLVPLLVVSLKVPASTAGKQMMESRKPADHFVLFRNRAFLAYFIFSLGLSIYLSITMIFLAYILEYAGCAPSLLGLIVGWRALMEIISMSVSSRCIHRFSYPCILTVSGILFAIEHLSYRFADGLFSLLVIISFSGLAGGIFYSIGPCYVLHIIPDELNHTAQSYIAIGTALVGIAGTFFGGSIIAKAGITTLTTSCGFVISALTIFFVIISKRKEAVG